MMWYWGCMAQRPNINIFDLELNDEQMQHVYRFLKLGTFKRTEYEALRGITRWQIDQHNDLKKRDGISR